MQLTEPISLDKTFTANDTTEIATVIQSTFTTSTLWQLSYNRIPPDECLSWLQESFHKSIHQGLTHPLISTIQTDSLSLDLPRTEHLIIRDLDLPPLLPTTNHNDINSSSSSSRGRIVAYATYTYHPSLGHNPPPTVNQPDSTTTDTRPPSSAHLGLHSHWSRTVALSLYYTFQSRRCISLDLVSVLAPTHLRQGIARRLLNWIFPIADALSLPVVLSASPLGEKVYVDLGFECVHRKGAVVECDLEQWGGTEKERYRQVLMVRWPAGGVIDRSWDGWKKGGVDMLDKPVLLKGGFMAWVWSVWEKVLLDRFA